MCTGLEVAAIVGGTAAAASVHQAEQARKTAHGEMDRAREDKQRAEAEAAQRASAKIQLQRKALRENSLFTGGGGAGSATDTTTTGRTTLGV